MSGTSGRRPALFEGTVVDRTAAARVSGNDQTGNFKLAKK